MPTYVGIGLCKEMSMDYLKRAEEKVRKRIYLRMTA